MPASVDLSALLQTILSDPQKVSTLLSDLEQVNFTGLRAEFEAGDVDAILGSAESFLGFISIFVPQAQVAAYVVMALLFANKARGAGLWHPGQPDDLAELARDRHDRGSSR